MFEIDNYITEIKVPKDSAVKGLSIGELAQKAKADVQILGMVRNNKRIHAPDDQEELKSDDILILQTNTAELETFLDNTGLVLVGGKQFRKDAIGSKNIAIMEAIVMSDSSLIGQTTKSIPMRSRYGINLLAVARREKRIHRRLDSIVFQSGDVLLIQGRAHLIDDIIRSMGCLPLAPRGLLLGYKKKVSLGLGIFAASIALVMTGLLPVQVAFTLAAVAMVLAGILPVKKVYTSVDWSVIVLLGAMIPVGTALETTGGADQIANLILSSHHLPLWIILTIILVTTMFLSDIINNAATVVLMAPIAINVANGLNASIDPFLMAVALGGSCAFLTPIGHQSNTLVMGPGGYKFSDYWRMGLPLEILIVLCGVPLILYFWPV